MIDEYVHLMTDGTHIAFEATWEVATAVVTFAAGAWWQRRQHDC